MVDFVKAMRKNRNRVLVDNEADMLRLRKMVYYIGSKPKSQKQYSGGWLCWVE